MKFYIDTCIWIDYWENRSDNLRPLGEFAFNFFSRLEDKDIVYYSDLTIKELRKKYTTENIINIFFVAENKLKHLETFKSHVHTASIIARTGSLHWTDALHVAIAKDNNALFVTRDKQILNSGFIQAITPEELF